MYCYDLMFAALDGNQKCLDLFKSLKKDFGMFNLSTDYLSYYANGKIIYYLINK